MTQIPENIMARIKKVYRLYKEGYRGEADAAKLILDKLLEKYSVSIDQLVESVDLKTYEFKYRTEAELFIIYQIIAVKCGREIGKTTKYYKSGAGVKAAIIDLTIIQYIDVKEFVDFYLPLWRKELKRIQKEVNSAFIHKHDLALSRNEDDGNEFNLNEYLKMMKTQSMLSDAKFQRKLPSGQLKIGN